MRVRRETDASKRVRGGQSSGCKPNAFAVVRFGRRVIPSARVWKQTEHGNERGKSFTDDWIPSYRDARADAAGNAVAFARWGGIGNSVAAGSCIASDV